MVNFDIFAFPKINYNYVRINMFGLLGHGAYADAWIVEQFIAVVIRLLIYAIPGSTLLVFRETIFMHKH